jgi:hypothetical protein
MNLWQVVFKPLLKNLIKEMFVSPIVSGNIYQSLTPLFETHFKLPHGMIISEHLFYPCPSGARLVVNV